MPGMWANGILLTTPCAVGVLLPAVQVSTVPCEARPQPSQLGRPVLTV